MKKTIFNLILAAIAITSLNTGCDPHYYVDPLPPIDSGKFYLHLHTNIDTNEVEGYSNIYTTSDGRKISLTLSQLYLSHIRLVSTNGNTYTIPAKIVLKTLGTEQYFVANVPVGTYRTVVMLVGVENMDITDTVLNHPEMWFGSTAQSDAFVFMNVQGKIDTTTNATGTIAQMQPFIYKVGGHRFNTITMPVHNPLFTVTKDQATLAHIAIDYSKLFTNVRLDQAANLMITTLADNDSGVINTVNQNIAEMFSYEE